MTDNSYVHATIWGMDNYVIGLGSNLGDSLANLRSACVAMAALPGTVLTRCSPIYRSAPVGPPQPYYLNAAVLLASELGPYVLLAALQGIEVEHSRDHKVHQGARTLDLDILWRSGKPVSTERLTIPHSELTQRWWAMRPLLDVAPELGEEYSPFLSSLPPHPEPISEGLDG